MGNVIDKINLYLKEYNIDDAALFSKNKHIHFEKVGIIKASYVARTLYNGSGLHLKYYDWFSLFTKEGVFKDEVQRHIRRVAGKLGAEVMLKSPNKHGAPKGTVPWNKYKKFPDAKSWNRGKTKHNNETLMQFSINRMGDKNPCHKISRARKDELNAQLSVIMKQLIEDGKFTPKTTNRLSRANKKLKYNEQLYRSSWELLFHLLYPQFEYETLRIPYIIDEVKRIYIIDFVDHVSKVVYEVKPKNLFDTEKNKLKELSIIDWCNNNGYTYNRFTQDNILQFGGTVTTIIETLLADDINLYTLMTNLLKSYLK